MGTAPTLPEPGTGWFDALDNPAPGVPSREDPDTAAAEPDTAPAAVEGQFPANPALFEDYFDLSLPPAETTSTARRGWARRHRTALVLGGAVAAVAVVGSVCAAALIDWSTPTVGPAAPTPLAAGPAPAAPPAAPKPWCTGFAAGAPIDQHTADAGEAAIAGFETGLYDARDGAVARAFVAPNGSIASAADLTAAYKPLPAGVQHCVLAAPTGPGTYAVDLFTRNADGTGMQHYAQTVTTTTGPDGTKITAITPREGN